MVRKTCCRCTIVDLSYSYLQSFPFQALTSPKLSQNQGCELNPRLVVELKVPLLVRLHAQVSANHSRKVLVFLFALPLLIILRLQ